MKTHEVRIIMRSIPLLSETEAKKKTNSIEPKSLEMKEVFATQNTIAGR